MHPRLSVSQISTWSWSLDDDLAFWARAGIDRVGVAWRKLCAEDDPLAAAERVRGAGLTVTNLLAPGPFHLADPDRWHEQRPEAERLMDVALALRPEVLVLTTGPAGTMPWERAADALAEAWRPLLAEADREGLVVALEHTHALRTDVGFVHTLRDAVELAWRLGTGVCLEVNACWAERNLAGTIAAAVDTVALVQVSDYAIGTTTTPDRLVPGDGDLPLGRIVGQLLDAGYAGSFDLEVVGPRIEDEGYESAVTRSLAALSDLLDELDQVDGDDDEPGDEPDDAAPM